MAASATWEHAVHPSAVHVKNDFMGNRDETSRLTHHRISEIGVGGKIEVQLEALHARRGRVRDRKKAGEVMWWVIASHLPMVAKHRQHRGMSRWDTQEKDTGQLISYELQPRTCIISTETILRCSFTLTCSLRRHHTIHTTNALTHPQPDDTGIAISQQHLSLSSCLSLTSPSNPTSLSFCSLLRSPWHPWIPMP